MRRYIPVQSTFYMVKKSTLIVSYLILCLLIIPLQVMGDQETAQSSPDGNWMVEQYRNSSGVLLSPLSTAPITANFSSENLTGSSGCNTYSSQYTSSGGAMIIIRPRSTLKLCQASVMAQEQAYVEDLKNVALVCVNESRLVLLNDDEEELVSYIRV